MTSWDDVGGNPCPGDVLALRSQITALMAVRDIAKEVDGRLRDLHRGMGNLRWAGAGADNISDLVQKTIPNLSDLRTSHEQAAGALRTFTSRLEDLQSQAKSALSAYSNAVNDLSAAHNATSDALRRYAAADGQVVAVDQEIHNLKAQRLLAAATHQPTVSFDHQISSLTGQREYQNGLRSRASADMSASKAHASDAEARKSAAKHRLDGYRDELRAYGKSAAATILSVVGMVYTNNPFVRAWDDVVGAVDKGTTWLNGNGEMLLKAWDNVASALAIVTLICAPIPVLGEVLVAAAAVMSVVSLVGHVYEAANHKEGWGDTGGAVFAVLPVGRVLGKLAKANPKEFDNLPGIVKRLSHLDDARHSKGFLSSSGVRIGHTVVYRVYAVPKLLRGPAPVQRTLLLLKSSQLAYRAFHENVERLHNAERIHEVLRTPHLANPQPASVPVVTLQIQTSAPVLPIQGSTQSPQGSTVPIQD